MKNYENYLRPDPSDVELFLIVYEINTNDRVKVTANRHDFNYYYLGRSVFPRAVKYLAARRADDRGSVRWKGTYGA